MDELRVSRRGRASASEVATPTTRGAPRRSSRSSRREARARGLWNLFLPAHARVRRRAHEPRSTRRSPRSPAAARGSRPRRSTARRRTPATWSCCRCSAPPSRSSAGSSRCSTGEIRSAFSMTEPDGRLLGRDEHRDADRARRRRVRDQRAQVVDVGRDVAALRAADRDGRHRPRRRAPPAPEHDPRPEGHARASTSGARRACSATTTARTAGTPRSSTTTSACRRRTCSARRATASGSPRSASARAASTTRCGRSGWPSARSR